MIPRLWANRALIPARRWPHAAGIALSSLIASGLAAQGRANMARGRRRREVPAMPAPVFILGFWRSGTTYLHELLQQDVKVMVPTTANCIFPQFFKMFGGGLRKYFADMADIRSGDGINVGWQSAQEDEFALMMLGEPSPYWWFGFPGTLPADPSALTMDGLSPEARTKWQSVLREFVQNCWTYKERPESRIVLKSPGHTARVDDLLGAFPDARFIHISRDPEEIIRSYRRFMPALAADLSVTGGPDDAARAAFEGRAVGDFTAVYEKYRRTRALIPADRLKEINFADLRAEPLETLRGIYRWLGWRMEEDQRSLPQITARIAAGGDHKPRSLAGDPELRAAIAASAPWYFDHFGYSKA